jgi:hypothetical protein
MKINGVQLCSGASIMGAAFAGANTVLYVA